MANVYVDSNAGGAGTGADWANAYITLAAALTAKAAGDTFFVAHNHAETQASAMTLTSPGTESNPCYVLCVNSAGSVPPVSADLRTTATVTTTGASAMTLNGVVALSYGISFNCGTGASGGLNLGVSGAAATSTWFCDTCNFFVGSTTGNSQIQLCVGQDHGRRATIKNCGFKGSAASWVILFGQGVERIIGGSVLSGGTSPTNLFSTNLGFGASSNPTVEAMDLSNCSAGVNLVGSDNRFCGTFLIKNCKPPAGWSGLLVSSPTTSIAARHVMINTDNAGTNYICQASDYFGAQTVETTIVRTGGATDNTTPLSWKIVTTANSKWAFPFESIPIPVWNDTTAANVTVTVYGIWGGGAVPNNDDIWIEISYLGSSSTPIATINTANSKADVLATGTAQTSDSSTWGGSTTKFKMAVTLSSPQPAMKGYLYATVKAAKASSTFYIDPLIVLS